MKYLVLIIVLIISAVFVKTAPSIKIVRTDVDSSRSSFVTAGYIFGIDIYADSISNCGGVSFDLTFSHADHIKFSSYTLGDFSRVYVNYDLITGGFGRVVVGSSIGDKYGEKAKDNPLAIHLEFVVQMSAPDFEIYTEPVAFEFKQPDAVTIIDGTTTKIPLSNKMYRFNIHGYVDVWPGDANNDNIVDHHDHSQVMLYNGLGSLTKNFRSFKRKNPSTIWAGQTVLRWDSSAVTYADCDGNGDITITDALIVKANMDQIRGQSQTLLENSGINEFENAYIPSAKAGDILYPINIQSDNEFIAMCGTIELADENINLKSIDAGDFYANNPHILLSQRNENEIDFYISSFKGNNKELNGLAGYLVFDGTSSVNSDKFNLKNLKGIDNSGRIFDLALGKINNIEESEDLMKIDNNLLIFGSNIQFATLEIFNITGASILSRNIENSSFVSLENLSSGIYFVRLNISGNIQYQKIIVP